MREGNATPTILTACVFLTLANNGMPADKAKAAAQDFLARFSDKTVTWENLAEVAEWMREARS